MFLLRKSSDVLSKPLKIGKLIETEGTAILAITGRSVPLICDLMTPSVVIGSTASKVKNRHLYRYSFSDLLLLHSL